MAKNSKVSHEVAVEVTDFFINRTRTIERKAVRRLGKPLNANSQKRLVESVDREIMAKFGFPMAKLFEL